MTQLNIDLNDLRKLTGWWLNLTDQISTIQSSFKINCFYDILECYSESHRHYHNINHLIDCLTIFHNNFDPVVPDIEFALWFHDIVYKPKLKLNEEKSALKAAYYLKLLLKEPAPHISSNTNLIENVKNLILATKHDGDQYKNSLSEIVLDVDLSILGAEKEKFKAYDDGIREEYSWVPIKTYAEARVKVLKGFYHKKFIYNTPKIRKLYEDRAKENLITAIAYWEFQT